MSSYRVAHFAQQKSAGLDRAGGWIERRQAACDLVCVVEAQTFHFMRKKFFRKSCFASAIAAGDEVDGWFGGGH